MYFTTDAAQGGGAAGRAGTKASAADALTRKTGLTMDEACQILNVTREAELAEVAKVRYRNILERQVEMLTLFICLLCRELLV
jgi:hypothetical protein